VSHTGVSAPVRAALGAAVAVFLLAFASSALAQGPPSCAPDKLTKVTLASQEAGEDASLIATHDVSVEATFFDNVLDISLDPPAGARVLGRGGRGSIVDFIVPTGPTAAMTVAWRQAKNPSDPEHDDPEVTEDSCVASRLIDLPVAAANRSRTVHNRQGSIQGYSDFAVMPAAERPDLSPFEITARTTSKVRFPSSKAKARTISIPLRAVDKVRYKTRLPGLANISVPNLCRFWWLTCGSVGTSVGALDVNSDALRRGIVRGDPDGGRRLLPASQPLKISARFGIGVEVHPFGGRKNRPFGYDLQVRQSGRLLARVRKAGRCVERRDSRGIFTACKIARASTKLR
jgi:hypothetical protein